MIFCDFCTLKHYIFAIVKKMSLIDKERHFAIDINIEGGLYYR